MTMKKALAVCIIALFIGLSFTPVNGASIKEEESMIPIEISTITADGTRGMQTISLTKSDVLSLLDLLDSMKKPDRRGNDLLDRFKDLFDRDDNLIEPGFNNPFCMIQIQELSVCRTDGINILF